MGRHFCKEDSSVPIPSVEVVVGSEVAVEGECGVYRRERVHRLEYNEDKLVKVKVFLGDDGVADTLHPSRIVRLPASLGLDIFVAGATPVTVTGILPPGRDPDWSIECAELVAGYLTPAQRLDREGSAGGGSSCTTPPCCIRWRQEPPIVFLFVI